MFRYIVNVGHWMITLIQIWILLSGEIIGNNLLIRRHSQSWLCMEYRLFRTVDGVAIQWYHLADFMIFGSDGGGWHLTVLIVPRDFVSGKMEVDQWYKGHQFVQQEKDNGATAGEDGESFIVNKKTVGRISCKLSFKWE